ncbi:MAG: Hsp20/alpha crystallin family protein [Paludibacterium sp.]|uniref:Hsp20/alpha crystallin family protein n=1 Tax=Paludibacterium sp. TaxID=1917523 RepID=UPI0025E006C2|nr:Hsp20/alpha crystallin family protein [Paludibacterium sp.]MBV8047249.1 Hsp20/alpha crystallin family protein [Paludibacterium sp.]MBV8647922.1 Hsp20/alpha crystallin family protein [Paludibacterium sp.]
MNQLIRRSGLEPLFDDMLKGFFVRPLSFESELGASIKLDVKEDEKAYTVLAEMPGVKKEDIQVQVDGNRVSLTAEVKRESETREGEKVLRAERYFGQISRTFQLAQDVDESGADAEFKDGVLTLILPKREKASTRRIAVK